MRLPLPPRDGVWRRYLGESQREIADRGNASVISHLCELDPFAAEFHSDRRHVTPSSSPGAHMTPYQTRGFIK
jgi:hypothetical protein